MPLAGDPFERITARFDIRLDLQLFYDGGVAAFGKYRACLIALLARGDESDHRVDPERHALLLSVVRIIPAPQFTATGCDQQEQAVAVSELVGLLARLCRSHFCIVQQGSSPIPRFSKQMPRAEPTPLPEACGRP